MNFTFDSFVVGEASRAAYDAARAVAERLAQVHNPLVIHGPVGSGKSHLLQAIEHAMRVEVVRMPAREYVAGLIDTMREVDTHLPACPPGSALLLDDLGLAVRKMPQTARALFARLDELVSHGVQVVITTDAPPKQWGVAVEVGYPDVDARVEILRRAAASRNLTLDDEDLRELADAITTPRELHGAVARIAAEAAMTR